MLAAHMLRANSEQQIDTQVVSPSLCWCADPSGQPSTGPGAGQAGHYPSVRGSPQALWGLVTCPCAPQVTTPLSTSYLLRYCST